MKRIEAVVRPEKAGDVIEALNEVGHPGIMVTEIEGHGKQGGKEDTIRDKKYKIEMLTKTRIEVIAKDSDTSKLVKAIREAARTGEIGDGKIFIYPVDDAVRIRTNDKGNDAI